MRFGVWLAQGQTLSYDQDLQHRQCYPEITTGEASVEDLEGSVTWSSASVKVCPRGISMVGETTIFSKGRRTGDILDTFIFLQNLGFIMFPLAQFMFVPIINSGGLPLRLRCCSSLDQPRQTRYSTRSGRLGAHHNQDKPPNHATSMLVPCSLES
jgi:hypothetical protein